MNLSTMKQAVEQLSFEELGELLIYIQAQQREKLQVLSPQERARRLDAAFDKFVEGLSPEELDEIVAAMNEEYIEESDESEWTG